MMCVKWLNHLNWFQIVKKGRLRGWVAKGSLSFCFLSPILEVHAGGVFAWVWLDGDYLSCPETFGACKLIKCVNMSKGIEFTSRLSSTTHLGDGQDGVDFGSRHWLALIFFFSPSNKSYSANWLLKSFRGWFSITFPGDACKFSILKFICAAAIDLGFHFDLQGVEKSVLAF